jgi:Ca-activated chloride channel homolog
MLIRFFFLICSSFIFSLSAQVKFQTTEIDFGEITERHDRIADFWVVNTSDKKFYIFRMDVPRYVQVRYSTKEIQPGDTAFIRIKYDPQKKGVFREEVKLHHSASDKPISFYLNGKSSLIAQNEMEIPCPDFGQLSPNAYFEADIKITDSSSDQPLKDVKLTIYKGGKKITTSKTDKFGRFKIPMEPGWHYFIAETPGYETYELAMYVNRRTKLVDIPMVAFPQLKNPEITVENPTKTEIPTEEITIVLPSKDSIKKSSPIVFKKEYIEKTPPIDSLSEDIYGHKLFYTSSNLVFLLDLSSSMNVKGRLELLKVTMLDLLEIVSPNDKITIIGYASGVSTILETTTGANKDDVRHIIENLTARGLTAGEWGLKTAYETAQREFIKDGNNQVILISDGEFNEGSRSLNKTISAYYKKGIKLSVVAIHSKEDNTYLLHQAANNGGGNFIPIRNADQAHRALKEEVRTQSRRTR